MCRVTAQAAIEEGDEDSVSREQSAIHRDAPEGAEDDLDDLPWHHAQLAMMYGRQVADDIVHPQMEPKKVDLNPNMMLPEGHTGAAQIWSMLRNESNGKLLKEDRKIPAPLKDSYGAFVRQLVLQKNEVPVRRNFPEKEDVPDMDHLLDRRRLLKTLDIRHKRELMGRSSKLNQDKTNILLYNNPLPDLVNASGEEGIDRYLPTWLEEDQESIASYKKWIGEEKRMVPSADLKPSDSLLELVRPLGRDTSRHVGLPRVTFLTEEEAGADRGTFSDKYKTKRDSEHSVTNPEDNRADILIEDVEVKPFRGDGARSSGSRRSAKSVCKPDPSWQPLTLTALVEYSDKRATHGAGNFRQGSMKMYPLQDQQSSSPVTSS